MKEVIMKEKLLVIGKIRTPALRFLKTQFDVTHITAEEFSTSPVRGLSFDCVIVDECVQGGEEMEQWFKGLFRFLKNIWLFRKALWRYRACDYYGLLLFMETCTKDMSYLHKHHGVCLNRDKTAKKLLILSELLKRIRLDNYTEDKLDYIPSDKGMGGFEGKPNALPSYRNKRVFYKMCSQQKQSDIEYACEILKNVDQFWD